MPIDVTNAGSEVVIRAEGNQGIELQWLQSYGVGIDCHRSTCATARTTAITPRRGCLLWLVSVWLGE